ncbi:C-C motif chemokine 25 [Diceros bicornis minor]|uniref:C-C motif chemokine 25 n=1 Tax=Diceros bicornis minor TaxID=77932 RepID=UPI0026EE6F6A|nr:C-C motif chemokine 25 [Diceros bicornis minor]
MNPWLLACLVACCVGAWAPAVHAQGVFEDCCLAYHRHVGLALLRHAQGYLRQEVTGSCNLPAVIFFFRQRQRMVCGNPRARWVQNVMKILDARNKALSKSPHGTRRNFQASHSGVRKLNSGTSGLPLFTFRDPAKSSKRNASFPTTATPGP